MRTDVFWVPTTLPGRLAMAPRPRGGDWLDDEMTAWRRGGVDVVVSLLTADETAEFDLQRESDAAEAAGIRFFAFPVPDRGIPTTPGFRGLADELRRELVAGRGVIAHCRQGIGRAGLLAAAVLVAAGSAPDDAVARLTEARGRPVPETPEQRRWLDEFARETPEVQEV